MHSFTKEMSSLGGKIRAIEQRGDSIRKYYESPNICKECDKIIFVGDRKVKDIRNKLFCNRKCAAIFNNRKRKKLYFKICSICRRESFRSPVKKMGVCGFCNKSILFGQREKRTTTRSAIGGNARYIYIRSGLPIICSAPGCKYDKHIEICHIKGVSSFPSTALVSEINIIENLKAFCPNHHWEYDNLRAII